MIIMFWLSVFLVELDAWGVGYNMAKGNGPLAGLFVFAFLMNVLGAAIFGSGAAGNDRKR